MDLDSQLPAESSHSSLRVRFQQASATGEPLLVLPFDEVGDLLGGLPAEAYAKKQWWTGAKQPHVAVWRSEGWCVDTVGFRMQRVAFKRR